MVIITGKVIKGLGFGHQLGFPTINIFYNGEEKGVFAGEFFLDDIWHPAAINLGTRPTVDDAKNLCEAFILDWDINKEIAEGTEVKVRLKQKIRDTKKFADFDELKAQIAKDVDFVKTCYNL